MVKGFTKHACCFCGHDGANDDCDSSATDEYEIY